MNITKKNKFNISFILEGEVELILKDHDYELHLATLKKGSFFGFWNMIASNPEIRYTARAKTFVTLNTLD